MTNSMNSITCRNRLRDSNEQSLVQHKDTPDMSSSRVSEQIDGNSGTQTERFLEYPGTTPETPGYKNRESLGTTDLRPEYPSKMADTPGARQRVFRSIREELRTLQAWQA